MRSRKIKTVSAVAMAVGSFSTAFHSAAWGDSFSYGFDNGQVTGSTGAGTPLSSSAIGSTGQDGWILTSGASSAVHTEPLNGFDGNYVTSPAATTSSQDGIMTRINDGNFSYSLGSATQMTLTMNVLTGTAAGSTQVRRSEMALGVDVNGDGKIRPTALTAENPEVGFIFGYEATGAGWYIRQAAFGTASSTFGASAAGLWQAQLVVDFTANPNSTPNNGIVDDGAGSLYIKQLADANGNPVTDSFHAVDNSLLNVNLGISRMATLAGGATAAANPANWNGMLIRTSGNGGLDDINIATGAPTGAPAWALNGAGNWNIAADWYPSAVPNGVGAIAALGTILSGDHTVFSDTAITLGTLTMNNSHTYVLTGAGSLTMQTSSGSGLIDVQTGTQKINLPLIIASNTTLNVAGGATLKISDPITVNAGKTVTQTGSGAVVYESNVNLLTGSSLALGSAVSMNALSISTASSAWTSTVDVKNHELVLRTGNLAQLGNQIKSGFNNGAWNGTGITSSAAAANASHHSALGYASAATLLGLSGSGTATFDGQTVDASSLIVKYTWSGDANLDGSVNSSDFAMLAANFGATGKVWQSGDFNFDGIVNALDFNALATDYGDSTPPPAAPLAMLGSGGSLVPEPATIGLFITGSAGLLIRRRRINCRRMN